VRPRPSVISVRDTKAIHWFLWCLRNSAIAVTKKKPVTIVSLTTIIVAYDSGVKPISVKASAISVMWPVACSQSKYCGTISPKDAIVRNATTIQERSVATCRMPARVTAGNSAELTWLESAGIPVTSLT